MRKKILIVITGSIASYKTLYLIRKLKEKHFFINVIMTKSAKEFITPLAVSSLIENLDMNGLKVLLLKKLLTSLVLEKI